MQTKHSQFDKQIDKWILNLVNDGVKTFDGLVLSLPGVYPSFVLNSIKRLIFNNKLKKEILQKTLRYVKQNNNHVLESNGLKIPHPLDFDWRFSKRTVISLSQLIRRFTKPEDKIILLGAPSLYNLNIKNRKIILLDKNPPLFNHKNSVFYRCDILYDNIPSIKAKLVVLDPPWYKQHYRSFIWTASQLCLRQGYLLVSIPLKGTRHNISNEIKNVRVWLNKAGFEYHYTIKNLISYRTPFFEINALRQEGIYQIPKNWRHSDLMIFLKTKNCHTRRPKIRVTNSWERIDLCGVEIRILDRQSTKFSDPRLISIVDGDILPSVSSRDKRRKIAKVWTVGNRIFDCKGTNILYLILKSLSKNRSPYLEVSKFLDRNLTKKEYEQVTITLDQMSLLINNELNDRGSPIGK